MCEGYEVKWISKSRKTSIYKNSIMEIIYTEATLNVNILILNCT